MTLPDCDIAEVVEQSIRVRGLMDRAVALWSRDAWEPHAARVGALLDERERIRIRLSRSDLTAFVDLARVHGELEALMLAVNPLGEVN